jgi:hypothetical protein
VSTRSATGITAHSSPPKALAPDDRRTTPAHTFKDGHNYIPSPRWVLFGHHFAAIAGAGPLVGPTLAAQFGFAPGFLWLLIGAELAGCVQDFTVLVASVRHGGRSLADVAGTEIRPFAGIVAMIAVLFILLVSLAGLGIVVVNALANSPWGVFTIGATIPIALDHGSLNVQEPRRQNRGEGAQRFRRGPADFRRRRGALVRAVERRARAYFHTAPDHHPDCRLWIHRLRAAGVAAACAARLPFHLRETRVVGLFEFRAS